jgi:hypothetical protein
VTCPGTCYTVDSSKCSTSLLGADFLAAYDLAMDLKNGQLFQLSKFRDGNGNLMQPHLKLLAASTSYRDIIDKFPSILSKNANFRLKKHPFSMTISLTGHSHSQLNQRPRPLRSPEQYEAARSEFSKLEELGIVSRADNCPYGSPLHMVHKPNGEWRPCGDYRLINRFMVKDTYPVPDLLSFHHQLQDCFVFSKIDLVKAFHQIPMDPKSKAYTAIMTPFGKFVYNVMPFGLANSTATFQYALDEILKSCKQFCFVYVDDIIIFSRDHDEQKRHLTKVLQALQRAGMTIAENKCSFGVPSVSFLGHLVSKDGISPLPDRVHDILNISSPTNITKVRSFLGLVNFYNRFIPKLAHHARPLTDLLRKRSRFQWSESHQNAFEKLKLPLHMRAI